MAIESLVALALATLVLLVFSIYANKHRSDNSGKDSKRNHEEMRSVLPSLGHIHATHMMNLNNPDENQILELIRTAENVTRPLAPCLTEYGASLFIRLADGREIELRFPDDLCVNHLR
jgi:hypothetical protein